MQTVELIEKLSAELRPSSAKSADLLLPMAGGAALSFLLMWAWFGLRPDLATAVGTMGYWTKFIYTLWLSAAALWLVERSGRPGTPLLRPLLTAGFAILSIAALGFMQLAAAPAEARSHLMLGSTHVVCPWRILVLALPILAGTLLGLRRMAPTRLVFSGLAAGLLAGSAGAWIYALHCDEQAMAFVAIWYTLGIAAATALGAALGKRVLRW